MKYKKRGILKTNKFDRILIDFYYSNQQNCNMFIQEIIFQRALLIFDFLFSRYQQLKYELVKDEDGQALNMIRELRIIAFNHDKQGVLGKKK